jgi:hypothetical protein
LQEIGIEQADFDGINKARENILECINSKESPNEESMLRVNSSLGELLETQRELNSKIC